MIANAYDRGPVSAPIAIPDEEHERWLDRGRALAEVDRRYQREYMWHLGEWWHDHKPAWGARKAACEAVGLAFPTVQRAGAVHAAIQLHRRRCDSLSWSIHAEVASLDDERAQDELLTRAAEEGWSQRETRAAVRQAQRASQPSPAPVRAPPGIDLRCCSVEALLGSLVQPVGLVHADPPWAYANDKSGLEGLAASEYKTSGMDPIVSVLDRAFDVAADDCYLVLWMTFPKIVEWILASQSMRWSFLSGGAWDKKVDKKLGVGYHWRGDSECVLLYKKGKPRAAATISNVWAAARAKHSEKPQEALRDFVRAFAWPIAERRKTAMPVLDLYAGESASMARACRSQGTAYIGAEIDPVRHAMALRRLAEGT